MIESFLATDAGSGAIVLSGATNAGQGGVYVQRVLPSPGPRVVLPPLGKEWGNGLSGRIGAAGVYVAYADGKAARLYRYGGRSRTLATGAYSSATLCAGPGGRLWIAWGDNAGNVSVTRSNRAASVLEPVQRLKLPRRRAHVPPVRGVDGACRPVRIRSARRRVLARTRAGAVRPERADDETKVTVSARDAGDPVAGVAITVGGKHLRTAANGKVSLTLRPGSYSASAAAARLLTRLGSGLGAVSRCSRSSARASWARERMPQLAVGARRGSPRPFYASRRPRRRSPGWSVR